MAERDLQRVEKGDCLGLGGAKISWWWWLRDKEIGVAQYRMDYKTERENQAGWKARSQQPTSVDCEVVKLLRRDVVLVMEEGYRWESEYRWERI